MKDFIENLLQKDRSGYIVLIIYFIFYLISAILMPIENMPILNNLIQILVNPVIFLGIPCLLLKHARYKELLKIYKNYTIEEFLTVYRQTYNIAYKDNYSRPTLEKLRPLARNLLCINIEDNCSSWLLEDWIKEGKSIEDFIKEEYKEQYKFSLFHGIWSYVILGIFFQLSIWGIIGYDEE